MKFRVLALRLAWLGVSSDVVAHHNVARTYDLKREFKLEGKIRQLLLRNPHSFLQLEVRDQDGNVQLWSLEFPNGANSLRKQGIVPGALKSGDEVTVAVNPSQHSTTASDKRGNIITLHRTS